MIDFKFEVSLPVTIKTWNSWCKSKPIARFKILEAEYYREPVLLKCNCNTHFSGKDHAGPEFGLGLLTHYFIIRVYDIRHWDYQNNTWESGNDTN